MQGQTPQAQTPQAQTQQQVQTQNGAAPTQNGQSPPRRKLTDAERDKLFKDFQNWREQRVETNKKQQQ